MNLALPHTIENCTGEKLIFQAVEKEPGGDKLVVESFFTPGNGPVMHTHWLQDECLTVIKGRLGYQVQGQPAQYAFEGETVLFKKGTPHRCWADGQDVLHCKGWIKPINTFPFYISAIFAAQNKSGKAEPERFDGAYLVYQYASEYDLTELPWFIKKVIIPIIYYTGIISGRYKHFKNAPRPVKPVHRK